MKNEIFNFASRLENMLFRIRKKNEDLAVAVEKLMADNGLDEMIGKDQLSSIASEEDCNEFELDISGGNVDLGLYSRIARSIRLLSLAGQKPQQFMAEEADFLAGCPMRVEDFPDDDIEAIRFNPNVEAIDDRTFYYVWLYIGEFDEIRMAAKIDSESGALHPLPFISVKSKYDINRHAKGGTLTADERRVLIDRIFYASLIPDEITDDNDEYSEWTEDIEDDEEDDWTEDIEDDEEDDWTEDIEDDEEGEWTEDINKALAEETRLFDEHTITITVLSVTDLQGQQRTLKDGTCYQDIHGFEGKILPIVIGEEMTIYDPKSVVVPIPEEKLHTAPVIFHSEELVSDHEVHHIIKTKDSIYFLMEHKDQ